MNYHFTMRGAFTDKVDKLLSCFRGLCLILTAFQKHLLNRRGYKISWTEEYSIYSHGGFYELNRRTAIFGAKSA